MKEKEEREHTEKEEQEEEQKGVGEIMTRVIPRLLRSGLETNQGTLNKSQITASSLETRYL